ncbi:AMP-binding protein [Paraburkholderia pallida]|uniref:Long-chain-fatty-acid--CoA ligase n=1 Tax=Paraburkholderia pallida TaxID=2547399 RepID=A0A4P7D572_9BURK|nr:AMP-binding protein [Paraburkholderia pallida]QBR03971.1 long-chain-fatty-acid--CoA ligase [Paraburkholderia pallida]
MNMKPWLKSYGAVSHEIDADRYPSLTVELDRAMLEYAELPAFHAFGQTLTYAEVDARSRALAGYLQKKLGVRKGDRIAVMLPNIFAFPIICIAIARIGAVQVNVNPLYTPRELAHQLNDAGAGIIIAYAGATPTLAQIVDQTEVKTVITAGLGDGSGTAVPGPEVDRSLLSATTVNEAIEQGYALTYESPAISGDDLLFLQYTGGTTGLSKGAQLTHRNIIANIEQTGAFFAEARRPGQEVIVTAIPLYHIFALAVNFFGHFLIGAQNWLIANPRDMDAFIETLKAARPTVLTGVNTLYAALAAHPRAAEVDWTRLRLVCGGGAAVIEAVSQRWEAVTGTIIREGYGLSETSPVVSTNPMFVDRFTGTTGLPVPSTDIKLLDDEDKIVDIGKPGEICVKGPQVTRGYWRNPEATEKAFTADGYFRTGDIGIFDDNGFLKIVDRKKDMVLVSGFNVYPNDVEAVVTAFPGVIECACVGVPDDKTGEAVKIFVVAAPGVRLSEEALIAHCRTEMAAYKVPKIVRLVEALPKSTVGKILRRELRDAG